MTATEADTVTLDTPTLSAATVTLLFAVLCGMALSALPQEGNLGGALDAVKNVVYVLTVPLFDLSRRFFSRAKSRAARTAEVPPQQVPIFWVPRLSPPSCCSS